MMTRALIAGFGSEVVKLAASESYPADQDPNLPWMADTEARGIKGPVSLPSRVPTGHLGDVGSIAKGDGQDDGYVKGEEQTGAQASD